MTTATVDIAPRIHALAIGGLQSSEFAQAWRNLQSTTHFSQTPSIEQAADTLAASDRKPDLIVIAQTRPNQIDQQQIHALRRLAPLARVVGLFGSWCEGEGRTGSPWPAVPRLYWHQWPVAGQREVEHLAEAVDSWWQLPLTAGPDERFLISPEDTSATPGGLVILAAPDWESSEALADACEAAGYQSLWYRRDKPPRTHGVVAVVWDGSGLDANAQSDLQHLHQEFPDVPLVALLNYPRTDDIHRALQAGATTILSKPLLVDDLLQSLTPTMQTASAR
jgi:CheY-like chemotaxis protein